MEEDELGSECKITRVGMRKTCEKFVSVAGGEA
jgi:hypothetical protein